MITVEGFFFVNKHFATFFGKILVFQNRMC